MSPVLSVLKSFAIDRLGVQLDAYAWYRHRLAEKYFVAGTIECLNVGTGGGFETLFLLRNGNTVTTLEIDKDTAERTVQRVIRSGLASLHTSIVGHVCSMPLDRKYDQIVMLEVLEHIMDDALAINVLSRNLAVGGRLIISTPTQSNGLLRGDRLSEREDGGHVRVGYDGPELDAMLRENALRLVTRRYNGNRLLRHQSLLERRLRKWCLPIGVTFGLISRLPLRLLDFPWGGWYDQITVAERISIQSELSDS